jgi:hypothetical protein
VIITPAKFSLAPGLTCAFSASGGTGPYAYSVLPGGAGGTIDSVTGIYTAPSVLGHDVIQVVDSILATVTAQIMIGDALLLLCDIIATGLGLAPDRVYIWNQKLFQPQDNGLYIALGVAYRKPFANVNRVINGIEYQDVSIMDHIDINVMSRAQVARTRSWEVIAALKSAYSRQQQAANAFRVASLPTGFVCLNNADGAGIPYRFTAGVNVSYVESKQTAIPYYDTFQAVTVINDA